MNHLTHQKTAALPGEAPRALVEAARTASPVLRRYADDAERESRLAPEAERALRDAGMFRLGTPRHLGGHELPLTAAVDVLAEIGLACPSSAWVAMVSYVAQQIAASFGEKARFDLWGDGPDVPLCGVFSTVGVTAEPTEGGLVVSGRWSWASGCRQAEWGVLGVPLPRPGADGTEPGVALVRTSELTVEATWDMTGMRGTGSDTLVADGVFVPYHRTRTFSDVVTSDERAVEPLYRVPPGSLTLTSLAPLLGAARAVFDLTLEAVEKGKPLAMSLHRRAADSPSVQAALADAATLIDSAALHLARSAEAVDAAAASATAPTLRDRARVRMDVGHASTCLRQAVQLLLTVSGAGSFSRTAVIQRYWRDLETATRHPTLNPGLAREMYGRALVGDERPVSPMV
ncbi:acyl-CoA dehydrogenase family protein [Streptomyces sp. YU58]|uniref:acyl-CoA dehydrogenase family protein n=1 Tax=Streptomyces sp. SX92 TaxID=3158972 RepID=UPI0027B9886B|nr:acyl-CoA dehydrogenase family protein [Streptomyces coralus]WLW58128.1 acyl-CoA dehydrogenase family protein [Streptomyces coralus]